MKNLTALMLLLFSITILTGCATNPDFGLYKQVIQNDQNIRVLADGVSRTNQSFKESMNNFATKSDLDNIDCPSVICEPCECECKNKKSSNVLKTSKEAQEEKLLL